MESVSKPVITLSSLKGWEFAILEASPDCITLLDTEGFILYLNRTASRAYTHTGMEPHIGSRWGAHFTNSIKRTAQRAVKQALKGEVACFILPATDARYWDVRIAPVRDSVNTIVNLLVISRDVTQQQQAKQKILWDASHDGLTGLSNRSFFQEQLEAVVLQGLPGGTQFGLIVLNIDHFKRANDAHGRDAGDAILCAIGERLRKFDRDDICAARLESDEFAVLLPGVRSDEELESAAESILFSLSAPIRFGEGVLECRASAGGSLLGAHATTVETLFKYADIALHFAKQTRRGSFKVFSPNMLFDVEQQQSMLKLARDTLDDDLIIPFYQPKVDIASGLIIGFEALLRWQHQTKGIQSPETLAAAFSDGVLAPQLGRRILNRVIADIQMWMADGVEIGHIAFNAAAADFAKGDFADYLLERLIQASVPFANVQLEVTETVFLGRGAECVEDALKVINSAGIKIALDDFGTGYASLSHLTDFPIDIIKVDRSFISKMHRRPENLAIVEALVELGKNLGVCVVAEGVESIVQHAALKTMGCPVGQGYLYGKARSARDVAALLSHGRNSAKSRCAPEMPPGRHVVRLQSTAR